MGIPTLVGISRTTRETGKKKSNLLLMNSQGKNKVSLFLSTGVQPSERRSLHHDQPTIKRFTIYM